MEKYLICGGRKLYGDVVISGSKNSSLAILMSALAVDGECIISNLPDITDVSVALEILEYYGADIERISYDTVKIKTYNLSLRPIPEHLTVKMRASGYLLGALLNRFGRCEFLKSGGCDFGGRPMNLHVMALSKLGATEADGVFLAENGLHGTGICFPTKTVGGTVNAIIAASRASGVTVIKNAAREPHVRDLARFLNCCGAEIIGAGTDTVTVVGKKKLHGTRYAVGSDMIEAGTFLIASLATCGSITCINAPCDELDALIRVLRRMGVCISVTADRITAHATKLLPTNVITAPYPEFPTDLQPQICALLGLASGTSTVKETVFDKRFAHIEQLRKFGLSCSQIGNTVKIDGVSSYHSASAIATDLRGGAAALICALSAHGESEISNAHLIERGYSQILKKLRALGADIEKTAE